MCKLALICTHVCKEWFSNDDLENMYPEIDGTNGIHCNIFGPHSVVRKIRVFAFHNQNDSPSAQLECFLPWIKLCTYNYTVSITPLMMASHKDGLFRLMGSLEFAVSWGDTGIGFQERICLCGCRWASGWDNLVNLDNSYCMDIVGR